jgi:hypothetical protein
VGEVLVNIAGISLSMIGGAGFKGNRMVVAFDKMKQVT